jgi:hypothetical protein
MMCANHATTIAAVAASTTNTTLVVLFAFLEAGPSADANAVAGAAEGGLESTPGGLESAG